MITFDNVSKQYDNDQIAVKALNVEIKRVNSLLLLALADAAKPLY